MSMNHRIATDRSSVQKTFVYAGNVFNRNQLRLISSHCIYFWDVWKDPKCAHHMHTHATRSLVCAVPFHFSFVQFFNLCPECVFVTLWFYWVQTPKVRSDYYRGFDWHCPIHNKLLLQCVIEKQIRCRFCFFLSQNISFSAWVRRLVANIAGLMIDHWLGSDSRLCSTISPPNSHFAPPRIQQCVRVWCDPTSVLDEHGSTLSSDEQHKKSSDKWQTERS